MAHARTPALLLVASALFASASAQAQQGLPTSGLAAPSDEADDLFKKGKALFAEGKKQEAYEAYKRAFELKKSYDIAGNLGNVELELGKSRDAAEHLAYCVEHFPTTGTAEQKQRARDRLEEAKKNVGALQIKVNVPDATVTIDGTPIGKTPLVGDVFVEPGSRTIEVQLGGYKAGKQVVTAAAGASQAVQITLEKDDGGGVVAPPPGGTQPEGGPSPAVIGVGIGAGVVGIGAGVVFLIMSGGKSSDREDKIAALGGSSPCGTGTPHATECQEIEDLSASQGTFTGLGIGALAVGGVALGATLVYVLATSGSKASAEPSASAFTVVPAVGPKAGAISFTGRF